MLNITLPHQQKKEIRACNNKNAAIGAYHQIDQSAQHLKFYAQELETKSQKARKMLDENDLEAACKLTECLLNGLRDEGHLKITGLVILVDIVIQLNDTKINTKNKEKTVRHGCDQIDNHTKEIYKRTKELECESKVLKNLIKRGDIHNSLVFAENLLTKINHTRQLTEYELENLINVSVALRRGRIGSQHLGRTGS